MNLIQQIENAVSDFRTGRRSEPVTFTGEEVDQLAAKGEFLPVSGTNRTVGGRKPEHVGLAYSVKKGLVVAASQHEADSIAKEIPIDRILAYAGILVATSFVI